MQKSNNEISREILTFLKERSPQAVKFHDMVKSLEIEEKALFKNLFFLEENNLIQLMSSYPTGATYPTIHMVKIREEGLTLLADRGRMENMFPLKGFSSRLDFYKINSLTLVGLLETLSALIEESDLMEEGAKKETLEKIRRLAEDEGLSGLTLGRIFEQHKP